MKTVAASDNVFCSQKDFTTCSLGPTHDGTVCQFECIIETRKKHAIVTMEATEEADLCELDNKSFNITPSYDINTYWDAFLQFLYTPS